MSKQTFLWLIAGAAIGLSLAFAERSIEAPAQAQTQSSQWQLGAFYLRNVFARRIVS